MRQLWKWLKGMRCTGMAIVQNVSECVLWNKWYHAGSYLNMRSVQKLL